MDTCTRRGISGTSSPFLSVICLWFYALPTTLSGPVIRLILHPTLTTVCPLETVQVEHTSLPYADVFWAGIDVHAFPIGSKSAVAPKGLRARCGLMLHELL